jgi:hypothetical protein
MARHVSKVLHGHRKDHTNYLEWHRKGQNKIDLNWHWEGQTLCIYPIVRRGRISSAQNISYSDAEQKRSHVCNLKFCNCVTFVKQVIRSGTQESKQVIWSCIAEVGHFQKSYLKLRSKCYISYLSYLKLHTKCYKRYLVI